MTNVSFPKTPILLQLYARAEAPCRDYYGLTITETNLLLHAWKITHGPHAYPRTKFSDIEDFKYDKFLQEDLKNVFGDNVMAYLYDLAYGRRKLGNLPPKAFLNIMRYLTVNDVFRLAQTSKIFHELCNADSVWRLIFMKVLKRSPSPEEKKMARDMGWKEVLRKRLAYIRKVYAERTQSQTKTNPQSVKSAVQLKPARSTPLKAVDQRHVKPAAEKAVVQKPGELPKGKVLEQKPVRLSTGKVIDQKATKAKLTQSEANLAMKDPVKQKRVMLVEGKLDQKASRLPIGKTLEQKSVRPLTGPIVEQKASKTMFTHSEANSAKKTLEHRTEKTASSNKSIMANKKIIQVK
ncbi:unnamed protein product [Callosobruchus maculatus]|uniref:F-box domain-containing protein n=1 Tax=Callosobruchus maculatus TaxID=64391 RepID=A0A653C2A6_CALMS|nr:unnamed protein product [Callosobruchus maculatus]